MRAPTRFLFTLTAAALVGGLAAACGDDGGPGFLGAAYVRSTVGAPWNQSTNEAAMDSAFGAGEWSDLRYETVNVDSLFESHSFIFFEGGDDNANEMEAFITANQAALESFVNGGGRVLLNSAPNEGDGMSFGFGVDLIDGNGSSSVVASDVNHPIFVATDSTAFRGSGFSHASVTGTDLSPIIEDAGDPGIIVLAEKPFGNGRALFGGMTTDNFHDPQPEAHTLRINTILYAAGRPLP